MRQLEQDGVAALSFAHAQVKLRVRGTFIDVDEEGATASPRAHSEPRKPTAMTSEFEEQQAYLAQLSTTCAEGIPLAQDSRICGAVSERGSNPRRRPLPPMTECWTEDYSRSSCGDRRQAASPSHFVPTLSLGDHVGAGTNRQCVRKASRSPPRHSEEFRDLAGNYHRATSSTAGACSVAVDADASSSSSPAALRDSVLASVTGKWRVEDGPMRGSVWTVEEGGRTLYNGKRFGSAYDLRESGPPNTLTSPDGWTVTWDHRDPDSLVWSKFGHSALVTWARLPQSPEERQRSSSHMPGTPRDKETKTQLQSKMQASAQKMSEGWVSGGRLNSAMAAIEEIPMRLSEDMQRAASFVVDSMQSEVAAMSSKIRGGDWATTSGSSDDLEEQRLRKVDAEKVIKNLEVIPTMVHNLLEARVEKARFKVRHRVHGVIQTLSAIKEENWEDHEDLVSQMRLISEEVEQIAGDAVRQAAQECHAHAVKHLNCALTALREGTPSEGGDSSSSTSKPRWSDMVDSAVGGNGWGVSHDPEVWSKTFSDVSKSSLEQVAAVVQDKDYIPQSFTNQVVADELLRARIRRGGGHQSGVATATMSGVQSSRGGAALRSAAKPGGRAGHGRNLNPGSRGHPDLCIRPCLYYVQGNCTNGSQCSFCHLPHPKRPVRFDKLHRESLKRMPFGHFLSILIPVLKQKSVDLDHLLAPCVRDALAAMWPVLEDQALNFDPTAAAAMADGSQGGTGGSQVAGLPDTRDSIAGSTINSNVSVSGSEQSAPRRGSFAGALQAMGFRPLLSMLLSKASEEMPDASDVVDRVLKSIHESHQIPENEVAQIFSRLDVETPAPTARLEGRGSDQSWKRGPRSQAACAATREASFQQPRPRQRHRTDSSCWSRSSRSDSRFP